MSMKRSKSQKKKNSTRYGKNNTTKNVQNQEKQLDKKYSDPEVEAATSTLKSPTNGLTGNLSVALENTVRMETLIKSENAALSQQPIEPCDKEKMEEFEVADSSINPASNKLRRGKSWIDSSDDQPIAEHLARRKFEDLKASKRSSSLSNKVLKANRELRLSSKKKKTSATDNTKEENLKNQKFPLINVTIASAGCKPKPQKLVRQKRCSSVESASTQIVNSGFQNIKNESILDNTDLCDKSYTGEPHLVLYYNILSPQARSCLMLMHFLNLDLELRYTDQLICQQLSEDFQKINAWHTIPKLVHNDLVLTDSHTILMYFCVTFPSPEAQQLFPTCPLTRLKIMNMLFFEAQVLFRSYSNYMTDIVRKEYAKIDFDSHRNKIFEAYEMLNGFLRNSKFLVGDTLTLADISVVATFSSLDLMFPIHCYKEFWPHLVHWFRVMRQMPMYHPNETGVKKQSDVIRSFGKGILPD